MKRRRAAGVVLALLIAAGAAGADEVEGVAFAERLTVGGTSLGLDDVFLRMWDFYFCYCSGGFAERAILGNQIVFSKARARREPVLGALA